MHNTLLQIFEVLYYFGELIATGMKQDMVDETVDSILVKDGRVEITFLFHSVLISQCCSYPYTLKIYDFLLVFRFLPRKNLAST